MEYNLKFDLMKLKKEFVIRHMNVLRFLLIVTMLISLTSTVLENNEFTTQVVLAIDQKHNYNEIKVILTTDKTRPLSSNLDVATTKLSEGGSGVLAGRFNRSKDLSIDY